MWDGLSVRQPPQGPLGQVWLGTLILYPAELIAAVAAVIASKESHDVGHNIEVLDGIASAPPPIKLVLSR